MINDTIHSTCIQNPFFQENHIKKKEISESPGTTKHCKNISPNKCILFNSNRVTNSLPLF